MQRSIHWPTNAAEAIRIQQELRAEVRIEDDFGTPEIIAGVDVSYDLKADTSRAVIVLLHRHELKPYAQAVVDLPTSFPYIPGLLSFREIPVILEALKQLPEKPGLLMVDGQGIAHPRRLGIAAHLGVLTNIPSLGVAKSRLTGTFMEPGPNKGDRMPLMDKNERIGTVLRSKMRTLPLFISPGHRMSHDAAVNITLECLAKYRLPEPTRIADKISKDRSNPYLSTTPTQRSSL